MLPSPRTWPQQVPGEAIFGASRMQENILSVGALPRTPVGELTAFPQTASQWGWLPAPQELHPTLDPLGLELWHIRGWPNIAAPHTNCNNR